MEQLKSCVEVQKRQFSVTQVQNSLNEEILQLQKQLDDQFDVRCALEKASSCRPLPHNPTNENSITKEDLMREIEVLEMEVVYLEKYLLALYRKTFDQIRLSSSSLSYSLPTNTMDKSLKSTMPIHKRSSSSDSGKKKNWIEYGATKEYCNDIWGGEALLVDSANCIHRSHSSLSQRWGWGWASTRLGEAVVDSYHSLPLSMLLEGGSGSGSGPSSSNVITSMTDHLGDHVHVPSETPNWISEEMIKCISAIYCQLADPPLINQAFPSSPISFPSPPMAMNESSPQVHCSRGNSSFPSWLDNPFNVNVEGSEEFSGPYFTMVALQRPNSRQTQHMLQTFRSLVFRLEKVDPRRMKNEEKLAFWINIHNALVMHAFLVYGIPQNNLRRFSLLLKAACNVGSLIISVGMIQKSILGCRLPRPGQWFQSLFFPKTKLKVGDARKIYAINQPEPLLHFALCSGSYSDPAVRMYTPKRVFQELEAAKEEYIYTTFRVPNEQKILLPKIVDSFAKESDLCPAGLMELIEHSIPNSLNKSHRGKFGKKIEFVPHNFKFRYLISQEFTK